VVRTAAFLRDTFVSSSDATTPPRDREAPKGHVISWEKVADLFAAALEMPAAERKQWLNGLDGVDDALRQEVASLLEANESSRDFLIPEHTDRDSARIDGDSEQRKEKGGAAS
jgi:hypothetical protein